MFHIKKNCFRFHFNFQEVTFFHNLLQPIFMRVFFLFEENGKTKKTGTFFFNVFKTIKNYASFLFPRVC